MATLVLTTVGGLLGGPIGSAVGAIIGQAVDQRVLAPKGRRGPRLGDLSVQTSSYGSAIPKLFGTMRVAGTVIWSTDLREAEESSGGGKGRPKTTEYSYSASFAVALSGRTVRTVHRIWADGKLLRGAAGDWKSEIGAFRLHHGDEDQDIDPLIAAAEGEAETPAYRGIAYAVFEDLQLADFGNRIPSLTFEVEADGGPVPLALVADTLSAGEVSGTSPASVGGYAATGDSIRGAMEALATLAPISLRDDGERLLLAPLGPAASLTDDELGAGTDGQKRTRVELDRQAAGTLPDEVAISYYEPARDYQSGLQRARRGGPGRRVDSVDLPTALDAGEAKAAAERRLAQLWAERTRAAIRLRLGRMELRAGTAVTLPGRAETFRIAGWTLEHMALELNLVGVAEAQQGGGMASAGRPTRERDAPAGGTLLALLDLPSLEDAVATTPRLWIAAAGTEAGWRRAQLLASLDEGASYRSLGTTAVPAIMGVATTMLPPGDAALFDRAATVDVELANASMWLEGRDDDALVAGANLAMLGKELIQFGAAEPIGVRRFRLSRLTRGRRGTEQAAVEHSIGERFVLLSAPALLPFDMPATAVGGTARVLAAGVGDVAGVKAEATVSGLSLRPPAPVHLSAMRLEDGTIRFGWVRRSRIGWAWLDGSDAPLGEEAERYRLSILLASGRGRTVEAGSMFYDYSPAEQAADGASADGPIEIVVTQLGSVGPSQGAVARFIL